MLKQRIITVLVLLPLILGLLFAAKLNVFAAVVAVLTYLVALEWAKMAGFKKQHLHTIYALAVTAVNFTVWYTAPEFLMWPSPSWPYELIWDSPMIVLALSLIVVVLAVFIVLTYSSLPKWWANQSLICLFGLILLPAFFVTLISVRNIGYLGDFYRGGQLLFFMFCLVWAADTGAYFAGKALGKHKLAKIVSPNKTWEGAIGGVLLSFAVAWAGVYLLRLDVNDKLFYSAVAIGLAILSVFGDLFESAMKRVNSIKDSGTLLPGHGGLLDRLDSMLVVAPVYYLAFSHNGWF